MKKTNYTVFFQLFTLAAFFMFDKDPSFMAAIAVITHSHYMNKEK